VIRTARLTLHDPTLALVVAAQAWDLATFGLAVSRLGIAGEIGPLGRIYVLGGLGAVVLTKAVAVVLVLAILVTYERRTGRSRWLALIVAGLGVFGAATNVLALV
jgi:hypothetical protein